MICICIIQNASQLTVVQNEKALSEQRSDQRAEAMNASQMVQQKMLLSTMAMSKWLSKMQSKMLLSTMV
jgi:hypothetical protein